MIDIVIPVETHSDQLDRTVTSIEKYTKEDHNLIIIEEPSLNVAEARQVAMDMTSNNNLICFLDYDSEMIHHGWLSEMVNSINNNKDAGAVFGVEIFGDEMEEKFPKGRGAGKIDIEINKGPAACMLMARDRIPGNVKWDSNIGLRNGWLGGDFEEVDYEYRLKREGLKMILCRKAYFHHTGGKTTWSNFMKTDRARTVGVMRELINRKYALAPDDDDFFKGLKYARAHSNNDCMLAPGESLRECYKEVIRRNGMKEDKFFKKVGLA